MVVDEDAWWHLSSPIPIFFFKAYFFLLGYKEISCPEDECSRDVHASLEVW